MFRVATGRCPRDLKLMKCLRKENMREEREDGLAAGLMGTFHTT